MEVDTLKVACDVRMLLEMEEKGLCKRKCDINWLGYCAGKSTTSTHLWNAAYD